MNGRTRLLYVRVTLATLALSGLPTAARAQAQLNYDALYAQYLAAARTPVAPRIWINDLTADLSARHVNDLVTIRVVESLSATGSADSNVNKSSNATLPLPGGRTLTKYVPTSSDTKFKGSGGTTRTTELSATLTARVVDVLPSGDLVVEGVRELDINSDRSVVVLSGVVRPTDILPGNIIASSQIGQLRIRSLSKGLIQDSLSPGWLIRILNKIF